MTDRVVCFTADQPHLTISPKMIVETEGMCVQRIIVSPSEKLKCELAENLFVTRTLIGGRVRVTDRNENSVVTQIENSNVVKVNVPEKFGEIILLENIGEKRIEFLTVEYR